MKVAAFVYGLSKFQEDDAWRVVQAVLSLQLLHGGTKQVEKGVSVRVGERQLVLGQVQFVVTKIEAVR